jgi:hypothetical protein
MAEFNVRADAVDVEQIMRQIRARIREKRGVDYTEEQIQELAKIRLEKFLDPKGVRSDLLEQFRQTVQQDVPPTYEFDDKMLQPILKLFFSPNPLVHALHVQTQINRYLLERAQRDVLVYEVMHNLVVEMTRTGIEVKNMQMRVESISSRLDFNERRARALEAVVQYRPDAVSERPAIRERDRDRDQGRRQTEPARQAEPGGGQGDPAPSAVDPITGGESLRSRRRRRRRGRRSGPGFPGDERRATSGEQEQRAGGAELTATSDEHREATSNERRAAGDEPEHRAASDGRTAPDDENRAATEDERGGGENDAAGPQDAE